MIPIDNEVVNYWINHQEAAYKIAEQKATANATDKTKSTQEPALENTPDFFDRSITFIELTVRLTAVILSTAPIALIYFIATKFLKKDLAENIKKYTVSVWTETKDSSQLLAAVCYSVISKEGLNTLKQVAQKSEFLNGKINLNGKA